MMPTSTIHIGLIGTGRIGRVHAANIAQRIPHARLHAVADIMEGAARQVGTLYGVPHIYVGYQDLIANPELDAIVICSATNTHAAIIEAAAAAGKHIFCEKPIDFSLERIDHALEVVEQSGVKLQIGFNRRFDANYARVHAAIQRGDIGAPHLMHIISRDPAPPPIEYIQVSGGIFLDMTIHDFDMARFLMGCEVEEIYATGNVLVDPEIGEAGDLDTVLITLKFRNGALGVIDNSRQAVYGYDQRVEVLGSLGSIRTENNYPNTAILSTADSIQHDLPLNFFMERYNESYLKEMTAFVEALRLGTAPPVSGIDGRIPVIMGLAAQRSQRENRPVRLTEVAAQFR
jgi:myo-inositol 2-dehydrogenase / D-chiro-inositol 1-dehydrogenase